jgi:hypothetical protein
MNRLPPLPLCVALLALSGCDFFVPPPPDPAEDGLLSCGETQPLGALTSADSLRVDVGPGVGVRIVTDFDDEGLAAVLRVDGPDVAARIGEFWDPVAEETVLTGSVEDGQVARVELFRPGGGFMNGALRMTCADAELCWNLADDDGDGAVDCADPLCARVPDCEEAQTPLETELPLCGATFVPVEPPVLRAIDDQQTLYDTSPLGDDVQPTVSFWGGAELQIPSLPGAAVSATVRVGGSGMLCVGQVEGVSVSCDRVQVLADGDEATFMAGEVAWLEPAGPTWDSLAVRVDCGAAR